ncbi:MAG: hypothetical protein AB1791_08440 [Chloroflexota bacterium]
MSAKNVILVAGHDYKGGGVSFTQLCLNRMERLLKTEPGLVVTLFDVAAGVAEVSEIDAKISFYTTHLGASTNPEGRGYGLYPP